MGEGMAGEGRERGERDSVGREAAGREDMGMAERRRDGGAMEKVEGGAVEGRERGERDSVGREAAGREDMGREVEGMEEEEMAVAAEDLEKGERERVAGAMVALEGEG